MYILSRKTVEDIAEPFIKNKSLVELSLVEKTIIGDSIFTNIGKEWRDKNGDLNVVLYKSNIGWTDITKNNDLNSMLPEEFSTEVKSIYVSLHLKLDTMETMVMPALLVKASGKKKVVNDVQISDQSFSMQVDVNTVNKKPSLLEAVNKIHLNGVRP